MGNDIVMLHGASAGGWCFDKFREVFEGEGWTVHTPDLIGHGKDKEGADQKLVGVGLAEYRAEFAAALSALPLQPVILAIPWAPCSPSSLPRRASPARSFW